MPGGNLGGGTGTQLSPYQVWDLADLNALRGKANSSASPIYVNFKADINFADEANYRNNFDTIRFGNNTSNTNNWDYVNIDGEGHTLYNFKQNGTSTTASVGLFRYINGSIRNLKFQNCSIQGNVSATRAVLVQNLRLILLKI